VIARLTLHDVGVLGLHKRAGRRRVRLQRIGTFAKGLQTSEGLIVREVERIPNEHAALSAISRRICLAVNQIAKSLGGRLHRVQCGSKIALT
jgi:hypothetical protein